MTEEEKELERYAGWVHLIQAGLYYMGYRYHRNCGNTLYKRISQAGIAFHLWSVWKHWNVSE